MAGVATDIFGTGVNLGSVANIGSGVGSIFSGVGDFAQASGDEQAANLFTQAASVANTEQELDKQVTAIQETQNARKIYQTIGKQQTAIAGGGFSASGTALDLLRSSREQGAVTQQMTQTEGNLQVENAKLQQLAYSADASEAKTAAEAAQGAGIGSLLGGALKIFGL